MIMKYLSRAGLVLLGFMMLGGSMLLRTQSLGGKILGKVTDSTHADLYDVVITATNSGTGVSREVKTDEYGKYVVESLLPGIYTIKAEGAGLETTQVKGVKLEAAGTPGGQPGNGIGKRKDLSWAGQAQARHHG